MRKEYRQALKSLFTENMRERLPQFGPWEVKSRFVGSDEFVFAWQPVGGPTFFIVLSPDPKADRFWFDLGWSPTPDFPELPYRPFGEATQERSEFQKDKFTLRLRSIADHVPEGWEIDSYAGDPAAFVETQINRLSSEEAIRRVAPLVDDAVEILKSVALPYFQQLLVTRGKRVHFLLNTSMPPRTLRGMIKDR